MDTYTDMSFSHTGMTSLATSGPKLSRKKQSKILPQMALGGISQEGFKRGLQSFTSILGTIGGPQICQIQRH